MEKFNSFTNSTYLRIIDSLHDGLYFVDKNRVITYWNKAAEKISGFSAEEVVGKSCADSILTHVDSDGSLLCVQGCPLMATMEDKEPREDTVYMHHKDGHRIPVSVRVTPLTDESGRVLGAIEIFSDVSNQAGNELRVKELQKLALLDDLTNLANRRFLEQELKNRLEELKRFEVPFGVLFMDIDHFKIFNDNYGHDVGDDVLCFVAKTLITNSRPFDLYGRWGGEEFVGIIRNVGQKELKVVAERVRWLTEKSYLNHDDMMLQVTISIGATLVSENDTIDSIIKRADQNVYLSKEQGRNRVTFC